MASGKEEELRDERRDRNAAASSSVEMSDELLFMTISLIGKPVEVYAKDGSVYSGIFHTASVHEKDYDIVLKKATMTKKGDLDANIVSGTLIETLIVGFEDIVKIVGKEVQTPCEEITGDDLINAKEMVNPNELKGKKTHTSQSSCTAIVSYIKGGKVFIVADGQSSITSGGEVDEVVEIVSESKQKIKIVKDRYAVGLSGCSIFGEKFFRQTKYLATKKNFSEMCDCLNEYTKKWKRAADSPSCVIVVGFDAKQKKMVIDKMSNFDPPQRRVKYIEQGNMCEIGSGSRFIRQQFDSLSAKGYFQNASDDVVLRGLISCVLLPCVRLDCCSGFLSQATVGKDYAHLKVTGDAVKLLGELFDMIDDDDFRNSGLFLSVSQTCKSLIDFKDTCKALSTSYDIVPLKSGIDLGYVVWIVYARAGNQIPLQRTHLDTFPEEKLVATSKRNLQLLATHLGIK
ncbi:hypothetical protein CASFOL_025191 [Castilleja foliolosa]|uniref:Ataxin 2 SM domain-containing protein n=1 Tax=Castilleja foliolosa TaxID=1961234 RepID=A0ABD3CUG9_9LAMI